MVFPSVPLYLDPPNWQQHPNQQLQGQNNHDPNQHHLIIPPQQQTPQPQIQPQQLGIHGGGPGPQQIRPASMAEQARQLKIPLPDAPVKCPRCESTNTKFCYFNNYSLTQPRHFCKTCRRYWTRNGALRNVPVGGGCRRNKRSSNKSTSGGSPSSSKLGLSSSIRSQSGGVNINSPINIPRGAGNSMSFMTSLQNIAQLGGMSNMGLAFSPGSMHTRPLNTNNPSELGGLGGGNNNDHHNLEFPQQFPNFLGGFEIPGSNSFQSVHLHRHQNNQGIGDGCDDNDLDNHHQQMNDMSKGLGTRMTSPVKMEVNGQQRLNLDNQMMIMGIASSANINNTSSNNESNNQYWGGNMTNEGGGNTNLWTDLSGLNSSSTNHHLL